MTPLNVRKGHYYLCVKEHGRYSSGYGWFYKGKTYYSPDDGIIRGECGTDMWVTWECQDFVEV